MESGWNGFSMNYDAPDDAKGMFDVFYLGINPYTNQPDTILLDQQALTPGGDTLTYQPKQVQDRSTIIVKVEDYRGYIVGEKSFDIDVMQTMKHDGLKISYANSYEREEQKVGIQYLTDGDTNGWRWFETSKPDQSYTFVSNRNAYGDGTEPMYIDIGEQTPVASIRFYAYRFTGKMTVSHGAMGNINPPCWNGRCSIASDVVSHLIGNMYYTRLPRKVEVYGCKDSGSSTDYANMNWEKLGTLDQPDYVETLGYYFRNRNTTTDMCWFAGCHGFIYGDGQMTADEVKGLDPLYEEVTFRASGQGEGYRYLKLEFKDFYTDPDGGYYYYTTNQDMKVMSFNELEVYTKKK